MSWSWRCQKTVRRIQTNLCLAIFRSTTCALSACAETTFHAADGSLNLARAACLSLIVKLAILHALYFANDVLCAQLFDGSVFKQRIDVNLAFRNGPGARTVDENGARDKDSSCSFDLAELELFHP